MKKTLLISLTLAVAMCLSLAVFAAPDNFVSSPTGDRAPGVVSVTSSNEDMAATLLITAYGDAEELPEADQEMMSKAYEDISKTDDLTKLNDVLKSYVEDNDIDTSNLAVSDLFDIRLDGTDNQDGKTEYKIVLSVGTLKNFVALLHMNDGVWELVENAKVVGDHLEFSVDDFSPFAIVVDTKADEVEPPQTGDSTMTYFAIGMAVIAIAAVAVAVKYRKQRV